MAETLKPNGLWHIMLVIQDLVRDGGLNPKDLELDWGSFQYKERKVIITHQFNEHLVVSMEGEEDKDMKILMDGFSKIVGYNPFCKYGNKSTSLLCKYGNKSTSLLTYQWDKINPKARYNELSSKSYVSGLEKLSL